MVDSPESAGLSAATPPGTLITRLLLSAQKLVGPSRVMFERIFIRGEPETDVISSLGLTRHDYQQMLRNLANSTR